MCFHTCLMSDLADIIFSSLSFLHGRNIQNPFLQCLLFVCLLCSDMVLLCNPGRLLSLCSPTSLASNSPSSCLHLLTAGIAGVSHHAQTCTFLICVILYFDYFQILVCQIGTNIMGMHTHVHQRIGLRLITAKLTHNSIQLKTTVFQIE